MTDFAFGFTAASSRQGRRGLALLRSLRAFGGALARLPVWVFVPKGVLFEPDVTAEIEALGGALVPYTVTEERRRFPFAAKVLAGAEAETLAAATRKTLIWTDASSLVLNEPAGLTLAPDKILACRPVDHTNIGSPAHEPLDTFWTEIYRACGVKGGAPYSIVTSVDEQRIRPYYNADMLAVRPERGLLRAWRDHFVDVCSRPALERAYDQNHLHKIFVHQAVLAGVILASISTAEIEELPHLINYPLHMHAQYPRSRRPACLNEVITCRYESVFERAVWRDVIAVEEPLATWLDGQMALLDGG